MGIAREEALDCFASDDLIGIGMEADAVRRRLHPEGVVSYLMDCTLHLSGTGPSSCGAGGDVEFPRVVEVIREAVDMGASGIHLRAAAHSDISIEWLGALLSSIKQRFPHIWIHGLSASEILVMIASAGISLRDGILRLRDAGLGSLGGEDAGVLDNALRDRLASPPCSTLDWLGVHRAAHELGMPSMASILFGMGETTGQRVHHLAALRELQGDTGGFFAFMPLIFLPGMATAGSRGFEEPTSVEYLKMLAISRLYLDNIENMQGSWTTQGLKVLQMGLRFGANDVGSVALQAKSAGIPHRTTEEELRRLIRDAGFKPVQRDALYGTMLLD